MLNYDPTHWSVFSRIPHKAAGAVGEVPAFWVRQHGLGSIPSAPEPLPATQLTRDQVKTICRDSSYPALFGYVCAMAWGGQSERFGPNVTEAWRYSAELEKRLEKLRSGGMTHAQAYDLFSGAKQIPGLGPSFFSKLLYFFSPAPVDGVGFYIMDQWTAKSVDLLTQSWVVRLARVAATSPGPQNKSGNFEAYCREVDKIGAALSVTGEEAEEMMMSKGGRDPWPWREHVRAHWPSGAPKGRYNVYSLNAAYPMIPIRRF